MKHLFMDFEVGWCDHLGDIVLLGLRFRDMRRKFFFIEKEIINIVCNASM